MLRNIILLCLLSHLSIAQSYYDSSDFYVQLDRKATTYTTDSIKHFIQKVEADTINNFVAIDSLYIDLLREKGRFNGLLVFD